MNIVFRGSALVSRLKNCFNIQSYSLSTSSYFLSKKSNEVKDEVLTIVNPLRKSVKAKNRLYVWGYTGTGALGEPQFLRPYPNKNIVYRQRKPWRLRWADRVDAGVTNVACGSGFSLIATSGTKGLKRHTLFGTGMNTQSQIGHHVTKGGDPYKYIIEPALIQLPFEQSDFKKLKILDVSCGRAHSVVLTNLGIITFGNNSYGQCGRPIIADEEYFNNPANLQNISANLNLDPEDEVVSVKCGQDHTCFLTKNGQVFTCGWSADGQTGQGDVYTVAPIPKRIEGDLANIKIVEVATKGDFVLALSKDGEVFGWGNNEYKQLSMTGSNEPQIGRPMLLKLPEFVKRPVLSIAASGTHCLIVDSERKVWTWGFGLLGKGPKCEEVMIPEQIPDTFFGRYEEIKHSLDRIVVSVRCGLNSSGVLLDDGTLFVWGKNGYGNLGTGDDKDAMFPLRVNIPARVRKIDIGPDQTLAICKTFL